MTDDARRPVRPRRMFVAVVPPPEALDSLAARLERFPREAAGLRWTTADQWHVTLAFLPAVPDSAVGDLTERLRRAAARRDVVPARVLGAGAFPSPRRARVLWAGIEGAGDELHRLATGCRAAARRAGVEGSSQGRFRPHVTLARLSHPSDVGPWLAAFDGYAGPAWPVERIHLVASDLGQGPGGRPRYETVADFPVGAAGS